MGIKIRVIVNGHVSRPPMLGNQLIGRVLLKNGENWVDNDYWNEVKNLPMVQQKIEQGIFIVPSQPTKTTEEILATANNNNPNVPKPKEPVIISETIKVGTETINIPTQKIEEKDSFNVEVPTITNDDVVEKVAEKQVELEQSQSKIETENTQVELQPVTPTKTKKSSTTSS